MVLGFLGFRVSEVQRERVVRDFLGGLGFRLRVWGVGSRV